MSSAVTLVLLAQTVLLVLLSLALLYPTYAYSQNVMHPKAVQALSASLFLLTTAAVLEWVLYPVWANVVYTASAFSFAASQWLFAREFVRLPSDESGSIPEIDADTGGFENARR